jgi:hypothetical protein
MVGVERSAIQSPEPIRKHWGPSRRYAPRGAHSTPPPATRDGVAARLIQPRRRASLPTVVVRKTQASFVMTRDFVSRTTERTGRPMARPMSARRQMAGGRPVRYRALCKRIPRPCRDAQYATPCKGPTYRAQTGVHPLGRILPPSDGPNPRTVLPGAMAGPTPSVGNLGGYAEEDVISGDAARIASNTLPVPLIVP